MELTVGDVITQCVLDEFAKLPAARKPTIRSNGIHEWVPCSGIVAKFGGHFKCICLGTGMKCLPASKLPQANGNAIHDWHAEIVTLRALNLFLLSECENILRDGSYKSDVIEQCQDSARPFRVKPGVTFHMYCSEAPCGDASMELIMAAQEDATPWADHPNPTGSDNAIPLPGRRGFANLGVVRRKPGRGDAPVSLSKSCSDKIAIRQCTSFLSWSSSMLISPERAYMTSLVLPEAQYSHTGLSRCFASTGRMQKLAKLRWEGGYSFHELQFHATKLEFPYSRRVLEAQSYAIAPCNMSVTWTASGFEERTLGGFVLGRKPFDPKAASALSRRRVWERLLSITSLMYATHHDINNHLSMSSYSEAKACKTLQDRRAVQKYVKEYGLSGWVRNEGDDVFKLQ
ncbi:hypothetical protein TD95_004963 [Thielaviopsis punctulata]|uniref:A to I editase domain-containing protein n=1 Tax=Thielaviopsis punctulata TaxID=72032 RepID=A0A0F4ZB67_9PEZI|nr:hypothetical protein TD95_004963 [Thielaviopsis punctulata]